MKRWIPLLLLPLSCEIAAAADAYFHQPLSTLNLPAQPQSQPQAMNWELMPAIQPYAVIDGEGEVYVINESNEPWMEPTLQSLTISIRTSEPRDISGRLFLVNSNRSGLNPVKFNLPAAKASPDARAKFLQSKQAHYRRLLDRNIPGAAWFRFQERETATTRGTNAGDSMPGQNRLGRNRPSEFEDSYELFTGGRAVSENLQLDRGMATRAGRGGADVAMTNLTGITVAEMNWKPVLPAAKPALDTLAAQIPHDQHALFFPSFVAMTEMIDEADRNGTPILELLEPRSEDFDSRTRYQKQLCLELNDLSRLLGPQMIRSVAFTGSDPYLRTGTDLGILFETSTPGVLKTYIAARHAAAQQAVPGAKAVSGETNGLAYTGVVSPDRAISSYVAVTDNAVIICNSLYQLAALAAAGKGTRPNLASQDEYLFFRNRYRKGQDGESAFLIVTDATIRRWCGPRWRIGASRRTLAAAVLADVQARSLDDLVKGKANGTVPANGPKVTDAGEITVTARGVSSEPFGTLDFLTPIAELPLEKASANEADAYNRWRETYQTNWRQIFDPIAVRFSVGPRRIGAAITVMPLIAGTDYRDFINLTQGSRILPNSGDPHADALFQLAFAINTQSRLIKEAGNFLGSVHNSLRTNPLGWVGNSISVYADQDPIWDKLRQAEDGERFLTTNFSRLAVALHCEVKNPLLLATFLTALRSYVDQTAPRMTSWQNAEYKGQPYVKISSAPGAGENEFSNVAIYYAASPTAFVLTLNEALLKRSLDRQIAAQKAKTTGAAAAAPAKPWLGTNLCVQISQEFISAIDSMSRDSYRTAQQLGSWNNLPILNEWKRRYPGKDPVKLHEQFWQTRLVCPGGGNYVWNEQWQTMESSVYGHPGQPKPGKARFAPLANISGANAGLSFENQGLSAEIVLDRAPKK